jgi:hypothetical protein
LQPIHLNEDLSRKPSTGQADVKDQKPAAAAAASRSLLGKRSSCLKMISIVLFLLLSVGAEP